MQHLRLIPSQDAKKLEFQLALQTSSSQILLVLAKSSLILRRPRSLAVPSLPSLSEGTANDLKRLRIRLGKVFISYFNNLVGRRLDWALAHQTNENAL